MNMIEINCKFCNKVFEAQQTEVNRGFGSYCSRICANSSRQKKHIDYKIAFDAYDLNNTVHIELTRDLTSIVDKEDFARVSLFKWRAVYCYHSKYYRAARSYDDSNGKRTLIYLHRFIMNAGVGDVVDHINHNILDNRKTNLRVVSNQENLKNIELREDNKIGVCGVSWDKRSSKWRAQICSNGKNKNIGYYDEIFEAVEARKKAEEQELFHKNHGLILRKEYYETI